MFLLHVTPLFNFCSEFCYAPLLSCINFSERSPMLKMGQCKLFCGINWRFCPSLLFTIFVRLERLTKPHSGLIRFQRLRVRYEKRADIHESASGLACALSSGSANCTAVDPRNGTTFAAASRVELRWRKLARSTRQSLTCCCHSFGTLK